MWDVVPTHRLRHRDVGTRDANSIYQNGAIQKRCFNGTGGLCFCLVTVFCFNYRFIKALEIKYSCDSDSGVHRCRARSSRKSFLHPGHFKMPLPSLSSSNKVVPGTSLLSFQACKISWVPAASQIDFISLIRSAE